MDKLDEFLNELSELTKKYGFEIGGCGCCGSPWIVDKNEKYVAEGLGYNDEKEQYEVY